MVSDVDFEEIKSDIQVVINLIKMVERNFQRRSINIPDDLSNIQSEELAKIFDEMEEELGKFSS